MTPSEIFWAKFYHLNHDQANKVLADLILTNSSYYPDRQKNLIVLALEVALNKTYVSDKEVERLHALLDSITKDEDYNYEEIAIEYPLD